MAFNTALHLLLLHRLAVEEVVAFSPKWEHVSSLCLVVQRASLLLDPQELDHQRSEGMGPFKEIALSCLLKINYLLKSSTDLNSKFSSDPMQIPGLYLGICPDCGLNGAGCRLWPFTMLCCWWDRSCIAKVIIKNYLRTTHTIISACHACTF